jgi:drug/metabolite transporter (DMT)-like permease
MMPDYHMIWVVLAILGANIVAGGLLVVGRAAVSGHAGIPPTIFTWFRYLIAMILMHMVLWGNSGKPPWRQLPKMTDAWKFVLYGCLHVVSQVFLFSALKNIPAIVPALWRNAVPSLVCVMASCFGMDNFTRKHGSGQLKIGGIFLTTLGGILHVVLGGAAWNDTTGDVARYQLGQFQTALSILTIALSWILQKTSLNCGQGTLYTVAWGLTFGFAFLSLIVAPDLSLDSFALSPPQIAFVAYAAIFPSALGFALQAWAMKETSPTFVMVFDPFGSLITAVVGWICLGEMPTHATLVSAPFILVGLYLMIWGRQREVLGDGEMSERMLPKQRVSSVFPSVAFSRRILQSDRV